MAICVCVDVFNAFVSVVTFSPKGIEKWAQHLPSRALINSEWGDNKGEVGGPFRSIERPFNSQCKALGMMNHVTKVKVRL